MNNDLIYEFYKPIFIKKINIVCIHNLIDRLRYHRLYVNEGKQILDATFLWTFPLSTKLTSKLYKGQDQNDYVIYIFIYIYS